MKKSNILNLIRYHAEKNESGFRTEAHEIAREFDRGGDSQIAAYIMSLMSTTDSMVPQSMESESPFLDKVSIETDMLLLPDAVKRDILGIVNAVNHRIGINKFLFKGQPGTGKTEAVKQLARILKRELFVVNTTALVDSKLGQTSKNVAALFKEIGRFSCPERVLVLFDEIDALALDRTDPTDLREMGRATTEVLKGLDNLNANIMIVATTNLFQYFDRALTRRFDFVVDFDCYSEDDLLGIAERMLNKYLTKVKLATRDIRLFKKLMGLFKKIPNPGELQNLIKTSVAFSDPNDGYDYFRRLLVAIGEGKVKSADELKAAGFTVREIGILLQKSKSGVGRELMAAKGAQ